MEVSTIFWIAGGIAIGAGVMYKLCKNGKKPKTGSPTEPVAPIATTLATPSFKPNLIKAKKAFLDHLSDFSHLLPTLKDGNDTQKWTEAIVTINDQDLTGLWKSFVQKPDFKTKWLQLLASWQVRCDTCKSFTCMTNDNKAAYRLPDGSNLTMEVKYKVVSPCWVFTSEDKEGNTSKKIITLGVVVPFSE